MIEKLSILKIVTLITSSVLIAYGWIMKNEAVSVIGAIIFLVALAAGIVSIALEAKRFREGKLEEQNSHNIFFGDLSSILEGSIVISGLAAMLTNDSVFRTPGMIIWFGTIAIYVICGVFISSLTNLPLKMTYGGWRIRYSNKRKS